MLAVVLAGFNIREEYRAERCSKEALLCVEKIRPNESVNESESGCRDADPLREKEMNSEKHRSDGMNNSTLVPGTEAEGYLYAGILEIPSINLRIPIINECSEKALKIAPCRYAGSVYRNDMVIAGHNYRSHFYSLKKLSENALIRFIDTEGRCFVYKVIKTEILSIEDIDGMLHGEWDLTLFTCTYNGGKRLTLRCCLTK